jgi:eukaryotic-like serine/threonine-protein kinase
VIGVQFGNYTTLALLGEGGMGSVYLAEHPAIGRRVAIKVLRSDFARDELALGRFVNEARAANAIRHPNIIEILDSGTTGAGLPYLVMELLEGEPLRTRLRRVVRLPTLEALDIAYLTASALAAAHGRGIVHRDLKPDNLFLIPDPNDPALPFVKVLDFGIAKLQRQPGQLGDRDDDSVQTQTGTLVGTPSYMSPEQCLGTKTLDQRTDIYSLGIILFEMLCGRTPFQSLGFGEMVHLHLNVAPPRPRSVEPEVPADIEELILRCLAKRPEDRFQSMEELMSVLETASDGWLIEHRKSARRLLTAKLPASPSGGMMTTTPRSSPARPQPQRRGRAGWWLLGVAALALAAGGATWWRAQGDKGISPARLAQPTPAPAAEPAAPPQVTPPPQATPPPVVPEPVAAQPDPAAQPAPVAPPEPVAPEVKRPAAAKAQKPAKKPPRPPRPDPGDAPAKM